MHKLVHLNDSYTCQAVINLPLTVQHMITEVLTILDDAYGVDRSMKKDLGGYVVILESAEDMDSLKKNINVDLNTAAFEYIDSVSGYLGCLLLLGTDYHLYFVMKQVLAPPNILKQIST